MADDKYSVLADRILNAVGGEGNIASFTNCMTRLRVSPRNHDLIDDAAVKKIPGVLGTVDGDSYQIILGPGVVTKTAEVVGQRTNAYTGPMAEGVVDAADLQARGAEMKAAQKARNDTPVKNFLRHVGNIFVPLIPAFVGAGLIGGIASILQNLLTAGTISGTFWPQLQQVLAIMQRGVFSYLVIFVGIFAAKEFGGTPALGGVIGGITLLTGMSADNPINNIFSGNPLQPGYGGVIGVLLAVWLLVVVEKFLRRFIPDSLDIILTPLIALLIMGLVTIFLIMPLAGFISGNLVGAINWVLDVGGAVSGFILGGLFLPLVMLGLHQVLTPIHVQMIEQQGMTPLLPILAMAGAGQVGAAAALWMRCRRNRSLTDVIKGALPVGFLGIGEPLIYGVTLPLGRPFITACIGGAIGGGVIGALGGIGATAIGPSGVALIPLIQGGVWKYIVGLLSAYLGGFLATYFFGVPADAMVGEDEVAESVQYADGLSDIRGI